MKNFYFLFLALTMCNLQGQIVNIPDSNFKNALVNTLCSDTDGDGFADDDVDSNNDGEIQVDEAEAVTLLAVSQNLISSLVGIESFSNLEYLSCHSNQLTDLNLSQNPNLRVLYCYFNQLTGLDVSQNQNLEVLHCDANQLTNLDVSQNPNLVTFHCEFNQLTDLDVSQNSVLEFFNTSSNQLTFLDLRNGNNINFDYMDARFNPILECISVDDVGFSNAQGCPNWCKDNATTYSEGCTLGISNLDVFQIFLYPNPVEHTLLIHSENGYDTAQIYDLNGELFQDTINTEIDVSHLASGIYFVSISKDGQTVTKKFIKS